LNFGDPWGTAPKREEATCGTDTYHRVKFHADRCHRRRDICPRTKINRLTADDVLMYHTNRILALRLSDNKQTDRQTDRQMNSINKAWFALFALH